MSFRDWTPAKAAEHNAKVDRDAQAARERQKPSEFVEILESFGADARMADARTNPSPVRKLNEDRPKKDRIADWCDGIFPKPSKEADSRAQETAVAVLGAKSTTDEWQARFWEQARHSIDSHENHHPRKISHAEPEPEQGGTLVQAPQGKAAGIPRIVVRFTGHRVRPLDPDNFAGSVKDLLDGLRHARLLPGDEAWRIKLETEQEKVAHFKDEKTVIEIEYPE